MLITSGSDRVNFNFTFFVANALLLVRVVISVNYFKSGGKNFRKRWQRKWLTILGLHIFPALC